MPIWLQVLIAIAKILIETLFLKKEDPKYTLAEREADAAEIAAAKETQDVPRLNRILARIRARRHRLQFTQRGDETGGSSA